MVLGGSAALLGAGVLAGCGGSGEVATGAVRTTPAAAMTSAATTPAARPAGGTTARIAIADFDYSPRRTVVRPGTRVTWTNRDAANHTVTFDTGAQRDLGSQSHGASRSFRFAHAGSFAYHCDFHPNMHGTVVVR